ncbi:hypothetical protein PACTADRAFT_48044 [Pachysolen tannophilus NRRL Y-2460]|uniref:Aminopeptidase P N-terminal domain-containing protein n=1 Tax=Pachysolen tannophilus NRRL Y-2460 TaxID=669874 RepID=A0A1E4U2M7_PACTA|nr:hypothetical protein PACTADRAFT_48044 [Pachysolen tannophilus NRRL Y-2460]
MASFSSYQEGPIELKGKKYPAKKHALNVAKHFLTKKSSSSRSVFFVSGEAPLPIPYCDQTYPFRQNRYFYYLTGCNIPSAHVLFDLITNKLTLFLPEIDYDDVMWSGMPMSLKKAKEVFDVDEVLYESKILKKLEDYSLDKREIYSTCYKNYKESFKKFLIADDKEFLWSLDESRMIKDDYEIALMRHAAKITDNSHLAVMSALPIEKNEGHIHAEFVYHSIRQGSKFQSYDPICCSGPNCSTLHYVKNDEDLGQRKSVLIDAGAEWSNYSCDVTRCFPIDGKWSKEHREIYDTVLDMQKQAFAQIKPGVLWDDIHILAHKILIKHFLRMGIFKSQFTENEIFESAASVIFFPHGLGHLLGMDTHDVGGLPNYEDPNPMLRYLRIRRPLQEGMVVTDEPGVYFSPFLVEEGLKDPKKAEKIDLEIMQKYYEIGGVRIEDDILVTKDGAENLTGITSDADEISKIVLDGISKGRDYFHCVV